jgi:SAM-dependent methyltransferase
VNTAASLPPLDPEAELQELKEYLGSEYDEASLRRSQEAVERELRELGDESTLYRKSTAYLYDLTMFAMSGTKEPYLRDLTGLVPPPAKLLDYGCGIGSDGLRLLEAGYDVSFADFANPSTEYLRWRLDRRGLRARVFDLDRDDLPGGFGLAYSFDVLEHVEDPFGFLARLEELSSAVLVNLLEPDDEEPAMHRRLPIRALVRHALALDLRLYRVYHGRSHLLLYRSDPGGVAARVRGPLLLLGGRLRR